MKRLILGFSAAALAVAALQGTARANEDYVSTVDEHPVRIAAYPVHMVGTLLSWVITRPIHFVMSLPGVADFSGHELSETISSDQNQPGL